MMRNFSTFAAWPIRILKWGLGAVSLELIYIFFFALSAIENCRQAPLLLVPSMLEHAVCALALSFVGAVVTDLVFRAEAP